MFLLGGGRVVQRHVLYLGEINDTQELAWRRSIAVLESCYEWTGMSLPVAKSRGSRLQSLTRLPLNHLPGENRGTAGRIGEVGLIRSREAVRGPKSRGLL
jgi:hypothetical protein